MTTQTNPLKTAMLNMKTTKPEPVNVSSKSNQSKPNSRQGTKVISGHFDILVAQQFKLLSVEQDSSIQSLLEEAINDLFRKYNKSSIA